MNSGLMKFIDENFGIKVFAAFTLFLLVISFSFIALFIHDRSRAMTDDMIKNGNLLAGILAHNLRIGVFSENKELLDNPVEAVFQHPEVLYVSVFNLEGKLLKERKRVAGPVPEKPNGDEIQSRNESFKKIKEYRFPFYIETKHQCEFWSPVNSGTKYQMEESLFFGENPLQRKNRTIGLVSISVDKRILNQQIHDVLVKGILLGAVFLIMGSVVIYLVAKSISKPLNRLTNGVKTLERGGVVEKVPVETGDEIGKLAQAFNKMAESLQRREKALLESEEKYRNILESMEEGYYEIDISGKLTFVNDALSRILGYTKVELVGMDQKSFMDQRNTQKAKQVLNKVSRSGISEKGFDLELIGKDDAKIRVEISASLIQDSSGEQTGFRGVLRDVTERRLAEEEKTRLVSQLQQAQKLEAIGTLAGGVAHDLNNILSGLINYPELLLMEIPKDSPLIKPIMTIKKSGQRAAAIVNDLLTLARRGVSVSKVINLNTIISEYLKSPEYEKLKLYHPEVQLETDLQTSLLDILGSPLHVSKTIMNLVSNATEAIPDGGNVYITTENRYVDSRIIADEDVQEGEYVVLTVSDTGSGISPEDKERIFEPFYTKKVMGRSGTGLGMAVIWGTVKDHRGFIDLQSTEEKGTTFTLYFPATREERPKESSKIPIEAYMGNGESILVVDDVLEQREIASKMLTKLGYQVTSVTSGEEAVEFMRDNSVDLLVMDMIMDPGINGLETYKRILAFHPKQKAVVVSGFSESKQIRDAQRLGAGAYLKKPYLLEKIGLTVRDELKKPQHIKPSEKQFSTSCGIVKDRKGDNNEDQLSVGKPQS